MNTVDNYFENVPEPARTMLTKIRAAIRSAAPEEATEVISYGIPAFLYKGPLVGYGAFKNHCSLFPMSGSVVGQFQDELKKYQTSKGTIQFALGKPMPATLVKKIVKARAAANEQKKTKR